MRKFDILIDQSDSNCRSIAIVWEKSPTVSDYKVLYDSWESFLGKSDPWSACVSIYSDQFTPDGIPYTYDLCIGGANFDLWVVPDLLPKIHSSKGWIKSQRDVVRLTVHRLQIQEWTPPEPFKSFNLN